MQSVFKNSDEELLLMYLCDLLAILLLALLLATMGHLLRHILSDEQCWKPK